MFNQQVSLEIVVSISTALTHYHQIYRTSKGSCLMEFQEDSAPSDMDRNQPN